MDDKLSVWLANELKTRGWSIRELGRRAKIAHTTIADVLSGQTKPTWNFLHSIAKPLDQKPEDLARLAGLLPPPLPAVEEEREVIEILRSLPADLRSIVLRLMRSLQPSTPIAVAEEQAEYQAYRKGVNEEIVTFLKDFPELKVVIEEALRRNLSDQTIRALMANVRIFVSSREERIAFAQIHKRLSESFARIATES